MFIELTDRVTGEPVLLKKQNIVAIWRVDEGCHVDTLVHNRAQTIHVCERYKKVKAALMLQEMRDMK